MVPDELRRRGKFMFGTRWKSALGKVIGRERRTVGKYMKLMHQISPESAESSVSWAAFGTPVRWSSK